MTNQETMNALLGVLGIGLLAWGIYLLIRLLRRQPSASPSISEERKVDWDTEISKLLQQETQFEPGERELGDLEE